MGAVEMRSKKIPITPRKRFRILIEWTASDTTNALTLVLAWFDASGSSIATETLMSKVVTTAHTWQIDTFAAIPPETARYFALSLARGNNTTKIAIQNIEFKDNPSSSQRLLSTALVFDDFSGPSIGSAAWEVSDISGVLEISKLNEVGASNVWSEFGIVRLTTPATSNDGGCIHLSHVSQGAPPVGTEFRTKIRLQQTTNLRAWIGLWSSIATSPDEATANTISGIGFRAQPAGSSENWFGVVRNGTSESTVDMGITANSTWRDLGFYLNTAGVFFLYRGRTVGSVQTTNLPGSTTALAPIIGLLTAENSAKDFDIDTFILEGTFNRVVA